MMTEVHCGHNLSKESSGLEERIDHFSFGIPKITESPNGLVDVSFVLFVHAMVVLYSRNDTDSYQKLFMYYF